MVVMNARDSRSSVETRLVAPPRRPVVRRKLRGANLSRFSIATDDELLSIRVDSMHREARNCLGRVLRFARSRRKSVEYRITIGTLMSVDGCFSRTR